VDEEMNVVADNLIQAVAYATSRRNDLRHSAVFKELDLRDVVLVVERVEVAK
jgi:hypothetical protein